MSEREAQPEPAAPLSLEGFRAELEVFNGPLDLLLHLIRQEEVDILEVSLARITDRYLAALRAMEFFDVNMAADFLLVAATLTELKSRTLLPPGPADEEEDEDDPGAELVRRLLEYKEVREAADHLGERAREQGTRFRRGRAPVPGEVQDDEAPALLEDLAVWNLMAAFAEVVEQTQLRRPREIVHSDVPISVYMDEVLSALGECGGSLEFLDFFAHERSRARVIGIFLALLELVRRKSIHVHDPGDHPCRIRITLRDDPEPEPQPPGGVPDPEVS
ncbi:MAG: segregation/condensation protein A [Candidatus Brocadiaceae bacterium]|nr:segregation/condensation protein A [Candidatus Brocadiaceae bacterium]